MTDPVVDSKDAIAAGGDDTRPVAPPEDRLLPLLLRFNHELSSAIPPVLNGDADALHRFRITVRRLRLILRALDRIGPRKRLRRSRRTLRRMEHITGRTRDLWVTLAGLDTAQDESRSNTSSEGRELRRRLLAAIRANQRPMVEGLLDVDVARLRRDLRRICRPTRDGALPAVLERVRALARAEGTAFMDLAPAAAGRRLDVEALHLLRQRARSLRYLAEFDAELTGEDTGAARRFRRVQDLLGEIRDQWLLREWAREAGRRARGSQPATLTAAAARITRDAQRRLADRHAVWRGGASLALVSRGLRRMGAPLPVCPAPRDANR
jgi:CHAD domain-containing protein